LPGISTRFKAANLLSIVKQNEEKRKKEKRN